MFSPPGFSGDGGSPLEMDLGSSMAYESIEYLNVNTGLYGMTTSPPVPVPVDHLSTPPSHFNMLQSLETPTRTVPDLSPPQNTPPSLIHSETPSSGTIQDDENTSSNKVVDEEQQVGPIEPTPAIDIQVRNVVCNFHVPCHVNLRTFAMSASNVEYQPQKGHVVKQKRNPHCYVKVYSSGKVYIVGCKSEVDAKKAARSIGRQIARVSNKYIRLLNYRISNVMATCRMPFGIKIEQMAREDPRNTEYEPELSPGLIWRSKDPKATLRIHTTGTITVTGATSESGVLAVVQIIYPIVVRYKGPLKRLADTSGKRATNKRRRVAADQTDASGDFGDDEYVEEDEDSDDFEDV